MDLPGVANSGVTRRLSDLIITDADSFVTATRACGLAGSSVAKGMKKISCKGYRFPAEIIQQAIWLYLRFTLSFRDVEDFVAECGITVSYETATAI